MSGVATSFALLSLLSASSFAHPQHNHPWNPSHNHGALHRRQFGSPYNGTANGNATAYTDITQTQTSTVFATVTPVSANSAAVSDASACGAETVTETATNLVTVTVTPGSSPAFSAVSSVESSSSVEAASSALSAPVLPPVSESQNKAAPQPLPTTASVEASSPAPAPVASSSSSSAEAVSSVVAAPSSYAAPTTTAEAASSVAAPPSSSSSAPSSSSSSTKPESSAPAGNKRGVAYNDASLTGVFADKLIGWGFNWETNPKGLDTSKFQYIPTCHDSTSYWTDLFADAVKAIGGKDSDQHIFSFNEPDLPGATNLQASAAADAYSSYIMPYAGGSTKLVAPSVTNGAAAADGSIMGLPYLEAFLGNCSDCQVDAINLHWYDGYSKCDDLIDYLETSSKAIASKFPHLAGVRSDGYMTTVLTEYGFTDGVQHNDGQYHPATDEQQDTCLQKVLPYLDSQDYIDKHAYFMVSDPLLVTNGEPNLPGGTFKSYSAAYTPSK
ncbi:MAG: hypothetical protein M1820_010525 [Bogoriella megaspora]|nr:MAG: hypothetical protein M1820_010525 [Bogoriella megaspora]